MRHLRLIALLSASTAIGGAAPAIAQSDFDPIVTSSQDNRIVPVSEHFQGITVFSEQELRQDGPPANDRYYLTALIDGQQQRLPIAPRSGVPFDVDLGPDGDGGVVAAYSRCAPEPDVITVRDSFGPGCSVAPTRPTRAGEGATCIALTSTR